MKLRVKRLLDGHPHNCLADLSRWLEEHGIAYEIDEDGGLWVNPSFDNPELELVPVGHWVVVFYGGTVVVVSPEYIEENYDLVDEVTA